jgi:cytoplasmic tRNA 2-thiolation protein 2
MTPPYLLNTIQYNYNMTLPDGDKVLLICRHCLIEPGVATLRARNGHSLCSSCFQAFVTTKINKRLSPLRPRNWQRTSSPPKTLLLPISFGYSSLALLEILTRLLQRQQKQANRTAYALHVLHVDCTLNDDAFNEAQERLRRIEALFPAYTYSQVCVSSIYDRTWEGPKQNGCLSTGSPNSSSHRLLQVNDLLQSLSSSTSRTDVLSILFTRSVIKFAKAHSCGAILWADSISRLSERVMSETTKGRGFSLPWRVSDGETPFGIPYFFLNGDVFRSELKTYLLLSNASLAAAVEDSSDAPVNSIPSTIDMLLRNYFSSAETSHPGLLSNVVRTSSKLEPREVGVLRCKLCIAPVTKAQMGIEGWKGIQNVNHVTEREDYGLCYGCSRSVPEAAIGLLP